MRYSALRGQHDRPDHARWTVGQAMLFAIVASLAFWALFAGLFFFLML